MAASSIFFRQRALPGFPSWFSKCFSGDLALKVLFAEKGDIGFNPEVLGSRRLQPLSTWLGRNPKLSESAHSHIETLNCTCRYSEARSIDTDMLRLLAHYCASPLYRLLRAVRRREGCDSDLARIRGPR